MVKLRLLLLVSLGLLAISPSVAQHMNEQDSPCAKVVVTSDLVTCLSKARASSDAELNSAYQKIRKLLEADDSKRLIAAQRLWIQYRDANCEAERALYGSGTGAAPAYLACLEAMTRERRKELQITYTLALK